MRVRPRAAACGPGRPGRGNRAGVGADLRSTCRWWSRAPAYGTTCRTSATAMPSWAAAAAPARSSPASRRPFQATSAPPSTQQGRGVLGEDGQRSQGAGRHHVVGLAARRPAPGPRRVQAPQPRSPAPPLRPGARSPGTSGGWTRPGRPGSRAAPPPARAREARPGADVGDPPGPCDVVEVQRGEAVGQVHARRISGRCDGGGRVGLGRQRVEQARKLVDLIVRRAPRGRGPALRVSRETLRSPAAERSGATTSRRSGSSPSL